MHPQAERAAALWALEPAVTAPEFDLSARRAGAHAYGLAEDREQVARVDDIDAMGVSARLYQPAEGAPLLLHLHGGGFVLGELETHDAHCRRLANRTGRAVLSVDYRRAPEHTFPAASDDVDSAVAWVAGHASDFGVDVSDVAVLGDSAGGHLAAVAAWRHPGLISALVLIYPCLEPGNDQPSYRERTGGLTAGEMDWYWDAYAPQGLRAAPELTLTDQDLSGFPPTLVITAEHDPLVDEGERLAARLADDGVTCVATRYLGMIHGFYRWGALFDASEQVLRQIAGFLAATETPSRSVGPA